MKLNTIEDDGMAIQTVHSNIVLNPIRKENSFLRKFISIFLTVLLLISVLGATVITGEAAEAKLSAAGAGNIAKAIMVFTVDGIWGDTFWAFSYFYNNRMNLKFNKTLAPGEHTIELMYKLQPPISITFNAEAGKEYEIVEDKSKVKIFCKTDKTFVATGLQIMYIPVQPADTEKCYLQQTAKFVTDNNFKMELKILTIDNLYGPYNYTEGRYVYNNPKEKGNILVELAPGKHILEYYAWDSKGRTEPLKVHFNTEAGKTYEMKFTFEEEQDKDIKKIYQGFLRATVVEKSL